MACTYIYIWYVYIYIWYVYIYMICIYIWYVYIYIYHVVVFPTCFAPWLYIWKGIQMNISLQHMVTRTNLWQVEQIHPQRGKHCNASWELRPASAAQSERERDPCTRRVGNNCLYVFVRRKFKEDVSKLADVVENISSSDARWEYVASPYHRRSAENFLLFSSLFVPFFSTAALLTMPRWPLIRWRKCGWRWVQRNIWHSQTHLDTATVSVLDTTDATTLRPGHSSTVENQNVRWTQISQPQRA